MPKYLIEVSYTVDGLKGLHKDKASGRLAAVKQSLKAVDGKLEALYWCLGEQDCIAIADVPDATTAAALGLAISASGAARTKTTLLLSAAEMDAAIEKNVAYRAPGR